MAILNNIKNVLSEKGVMSKWLAKQLQKDPATVSKWCNNHSQPDLLHICSYCKFALMLMFMNLFVIQKNSI